MCVDTKTQTLNRVVRAGVSRLDLCGNQVDSPAHQLDKQRFGNLLERRPFKTFLTKKPG